VIVRPTRAASEAAQGLWFLVLDELHIYRGRQGADVAFLVRRTRDACASPALQCVGTSVTMTSQGTAAQQRAEVARVASRLFGTTIEPEQVIGEKLRRTVVGKGSDTDKLIASVREWARTVDGKAPGYDDFVLDPWPRGWRPGSALKMWTVSSCGGASRTG
jgi:ATP-dependent helicase YprA (DUF1998 family)